MILHLLLDEKFSDYVVEQFASPEMKSDFVLVAYSRKMKHFQYVEKVRVFYPRVMSDFQQILDEMPNYEAVVFHGLFWSWQAWLLNRMPKNVKVAWVCWGGEIYGRSDNITTFLKPLSRLAYRMHIRNAQQSNGYVLPKETICKTDYCLTNIDAEFDYIKNYLGTPIQHLVYNYYTIEDTLGTLWEYRCFGRNIFVGNSATIENNYLEIFMQLKRVRIKDRQLIVPLSYGDMWVRNMILKFGRWLFGTRFVPLVDFMPREEYNKTMLDCAVMIQPHLREQAHGNIVAGLWFGMRVYLSEKGIDYQHFKSIGCRVYSVEHDLRRGNPDALSPLPEEDVLHNRQMLMKVYGKERIDIANKLIVKTLS